MSETLQSTTPLYGTILVTLDTTPTDRAILDHIKRLARAVGTRRVVLLHVADGWAARTHGAEAISPEISEDTAYLRRVRDELSQAGIPAEVVMAFGDPVAEIVRWIRKEGCDLVAMSTHGHGFLGDLFLGTTASKVQHRVRVPVLLLRAT
jgi:nucleotide-binding universal stress UspA family protein